jgi:hypothetical protein
MHASVPALAIFVVVLSLGCSQAVSPTAPTSGPNLGSVVSGDLAVRSELVRSGIAAVEEVAFKGRLEGTFTFVPDPPPSTFASVHLDAAGVATHVGRFTLESPHRVDLSTVPVRGAGTFALTAANGDRVTGRSEGLGTPTENPDVYTIVETFTVTGGTGRFAGASGSFTSERMVNLATLVTTGSFEGTISSPASASR